MKKLSFASPILFNHDFAVRCGMRQNTATETVPPQTQIASESDFFRRNFDERTDRLHHAGERRHRSYRKRSFRNGVRLQLNGNSAANGTATETQDGQMSGKTSTVTGKIQEMKDFMFVVVSDDGTPHAFSYDSDKRPDGLDQIKSGDRVTVTYTGILSEIESFTGEIISIEKVKQ